jgi:MFS family permease
MHSTQTTLQDHTATHWGGVAVGLAVGVVAAMHIGKLPPALPVLRQEFGLSLAQSSWIVSAFNTLGLVASIFMGFATSRLGPWRQCVLGLVGMVLGGLVGAAAPTASWLLLSRFLEGAGFLAAVVAAPGLIQQCALPSDQRRALSFWGGYMPAGTTLGMLLAPLVLAWVGWRALWLAQAVCALGALALLYPLRHRLALHTQPAAATREPLGASWRAAAAPLAQAAPWWIAFAFACYVFNFYALMVWLPGFLVSERHLPLAQASVLTAVVVLVNLPGNLLGGWLMQRGVSRGGNVCLAGVATLLTASMVFSPGLPDAWRYAACVAFSFAVGVLPGSIMSAAQTHARTPQQAGMVQGMINQGSNIGQFTSPLVVSATVGVGLAWDRMLLLFWVGGALIITSGWVIRRMEHRMRSLRG